MDPEEAAVWSQTTDGGLLHDLFGNYPTLHDARVRSIDIDRAADRVSMMVDYADMPDEGEGDLKVRMSLVWSEVRSLDLNLRENHLHQVDMRAKDGAIVVEFEQAFGIGGKIVAERFEAILVQVDPPELDTFEQGIINLRYR
jgi:hypothetical protein